jgi:hypothetical protein
MGRGEGIYWGLDLYGVDNIKIGLKKCITGDLVLLLKAV